MRLLVDTHVLLWAVGASSRLGTRALAALTSPSSRLYLSVASSWELIIKAMKGRVDLGDDAPTYLADIAATAGMALLPIEQRHVAEVWRLPRHEHADPFDRLLVAQARVERLTIVTADQRIKEYAVPILAAEE